MEIGNMTLEEAEKIGYVTKLKGYNVSKSTEKLIEELRSVWHTYSDEAKEDWAMLLGGKKDRDMIMAILNK